MGRLLALLMLFSSVTVSAAEPSKPTDLQLAIAGPSTWLNTSRPLTAEDLQGRILLLDFWTLGCINCIDIIPDFKSLEQAFGSSLTVIGVHSAKFANEKEVESIKGAVMRYGLTHPVVVDSDFAVWNAFGVRAWPTQVLMDPEGKIANVYSGEGNKAALEADIKKLLEKYRGNLVTAPLPIALEAAKQPQTMLRFPGKIISEDPCSGVYCPSLFVADSGHNRIVMMKPDGTITQTVGDGKEGFKDGSFEQAEFYKPQGMAYKNGLLYVADLGNHALRLINFTDKTVTTLAGTGQEGKFLDGSHEVDAMKTPLSSPWDVAFWPDDSHIVLAMAGAHQLWSYDMGRKTLSLLAGNGREDITDGHAPFASLAQPSGLLPAGDVLYFTDAESSSLRKYTTDGEVTTLVGKGLFDFGYQEGGRDEAKLQHALGLTGDSENLYLADTYNHSVRRYNLKDGRLYNFAGHNARGKADGALAEAGFNEPGGITKLGDTLYVADTNNHEIRAIDLKAGKVSTLADSSPSRGEAGRGADMAATVPVSPHPNPPPAGEGISKAGPKPEKHVYDVAPDSPITVTLALQPGWHINDTAPSQLSLMNGKTPLLGYGRKMLQSGHISLPKLKPGGFYYLDGLIYYCSDQKSSLCLIKSVDVKLTLKGKDTAITLPVN